MLGNGFQKYDWNQNKEAKKWVSDANEMKNEEPKKKIHFQNRRFGSRSAGKPNTDQSSRQSQVFGSTRSTSPSTNACVNSRIGIGYN